VKRERITIRVAPWKTMRTPAQRDADSLLERICDARTKASRERIQMHQALAGSAPRRVESNGR